MTTDGALAAGDVLALRRQSLSLLFDVLKERGFSIIGPTVRDACIVYEPIMKCEDLPSAVADEQETGTYRLRDRTDAAIFGHRVGPLSFRRYLYPPLSTVWTASRGKQGLEFTPNTTEARPQAFVGVRPCDLSAILVQDRVMSQGEYFDEDYRRRREQTFIVAVNCTEPGNTCFCSSMGTGPRAAGGFDLCLTEIITDDTHLFLVVPGSEAGVEVTSKLPCEPADHTLVGLADSLIARAAANMGRSVQAADLGDLLSRNVDNVYWDEIGRRCLSCTNCTLVCPTCFCHTVEDFTDLSGHNAQRIRRWDSCFTADFSYIHGGSVRPSIKARYRQWATHKLGNWQDQFGTTGCVGCGRCITWCPVGIDITEVAGTIRQRDIKPAAATEETEVK